MPNETKEKEKRQIFLNTPFVFFGEQLEAMWNKISTKVSSDISNKILKETYGNLFPYLSVIDCEKLTGATRQTISKMERAGKIKGRWFGGKKLYKRIEIIHLIETGELVDTGDKELSLMG